MKFPNRKTSTDHFRSAPDSDILCALQHVSKGPMRSNRGPRPARRRLLTPLPIRDVRYSVAFWAEKRMSRAPDHPWMGDARRRKLSCRSDTAADWKVGPRPSHATTSAETHSTSPILAHGVERVLRDGVFYRLKSCCGRFLHTAPTPKEVDDGKTRGEEHCRKQIS